MSLITRKHVFGVSDQVRHKPVCAATEASQSLEILDIASMDIILSNQRTTKALIRLRGCAGWSAPLLFAYGKNRFSNDVAQITVCSDNYSNFFKCPNYFDFSFMATSSINWCCWFCWDLALKERPAALMSWIYFMSWVVCLLDSLSK